MALTDTVTSLGTSLVGGIFDAAGGATQAAVQSAVNTGLSQSTSAINETIRQGVGMALSEGTNQILQSIGIQTQNIPYVGGILQNIAQAGITSAATVFQHIVDGNITLGNLPGFGNYNVNSILSNDPGVTGSVASCVNVLHDTLTSFANSQFNNTGIANFVSDSVFKAFGLGKKTKAASGVNSSITGDRSYAMEISDGFAPKYKFLFIVEFMFVQNEYNDISNSCTFLIKQFDRPKITIEHDEVNFYSFRSMVPKRTVYSPINIEIHDDIKSDTMNFLIGYLRKISPLLNQTNSNVYEQNGMEFSNSSGSYALNTKKDNFNVLEHIKVHHYYNTNKTMDTYTFHKPKILEATLDALDMSASTEGSSITLNVAYDAVSIEPGLAAKIYGTPFDLLDLIANPAPIDLSTTTSRSGSTNLNVTSAAVVDSTSIISSVTSAIPSITSFQQSIIPAATAITTALKTKLDNLIPTTIINEGLTAAKITDGATVADNMIKNSGFISKTSPMISPSIGNINANTPLPTYVSPGLEKAYADSFTAGMIPD